MNKPMLYGVGTGLGAVVGGLLGNQVGGGRGKTLATVAGAVGGGYAGHQIEKSQQRIEVKDGMPVLPIATVQTSSQGNTP